MSIRLSDIVQIAEVIRRSGIATSVQREAIIQRISDWHRDAKESQSAPTTKR